MAKNNGNETIPDDVWEKAKTIPNPNVDASKWRKDYAGAWIKWSKYGDYTSSLGLGWSVDHAKPLSQNGADNIDNWVPLQWENNQMKADNYPKFQTAVSSDGDKNISKLRDWEYK